VTRSPCKLVESTAIAGVDVRMICIGLFAAALDFLDALKGRGAY
jgi:hypothetical protein